MKFRPARDVTVTVRRRWQRQHQ